MLRLNLLGAVDLVDSAGRSLNGEIAGTRPLALLVFLCIEGANRPVRRDIVAGMLWPESEQKNARQSLNHSLYVLRTALGDVIQSQGQEELMLDRTLISSDCFDFTGLAAEGQLVRAAELYHGEFAAGLYVKESQAFDEWLSRQRDTWRSHHAAVLNKLYSSALDAGDLDGAVTWAGKLLDIAPNNDQPVRTLLPLLVAQGAGPAAIGLYERYARTLHDVFDIAPAADLTALIESLPRSAVKPLRFRIAQPLVAQPRRNILRTLTVVALLVIAVRVVMWLPSKVKGASVPPSTSTPRVAVTDFGSQRAAAVLNDALQWRLHEAGFDVLNAGRADTSVIRQLAGQQPGVTFVVGGDVETLPDSSVVAHLWLKDAIRGTRIWDSEFTQKEADAHLIVTQLSEAIAAQIRTAAGQAVDDAAGAEEAGTDAWRDVYRAREQMEAAVEMRRHGALSGSAAELAGAERTLIELTKREPDWALPWILRARIDEARSMTAALAGDNRQGGAELERGIRLLDSVPTGTRSEDVREVRGTLLYRRWAFGIDDVATADSTLARAERDLREALRLGHERSDSYAALSGVMFAQGKYAESFVYAQRAYDSNIFLRSNEEILNRLFNSALHAGDDASANRWCDELQRLQAGKWPAVLCRIHLAGFAPTLVDVATLQHDIDNLVAPPAIRAVMQPRLKAAYAISLAQLGRGDSARATMASLQNASDPEILLFRVFALAMLKDKQQARALLQDYLKDYRGTRSTALHMRWLNYSQIQMPLTRMQSP